MSNLKRRGLNILFFGSDEFSIKSVSAIRSNHRIDVVTPPDTKSTNPISVLKRYCLENGIKTFPAPPKTLKNWNPEWLGDNYDLAVVVSFGYFLPQKLLQRFPQAINVHPSILPKYRGAAPIQHALMNGDKSTGISVIELDPHSFDSGRILKQTPIPIPNHESIYYNQLLDILATQGGIELADVVDNLDIYTRNAVAQDHSSTTKACKITKEMAKISWNSMTAVEIFRMHRAIGYKFPLYSNYNQKHVQLLHLSLENPKAFDDQNIPPGTLCIHDNSDLFIKAKKDWIKCASLKFLGKNPIPIKDFINGYLPKSLISCFSS